MLRANEQRREAVEDAVRRAEVERRNRSGAVSRRGGATSKQATGETGADGELVGGVLVVGPVHEE